MTKETCGECGNSYYAGKPADCIACGNLHMTDYDRAIQYIKFHCRQHENECLKQFHKDIQWHKDNGVPYDAMDLAHKALYLYGH